MSESFETKLISTLKSNSKFLDEKDELLKNKIKERALQIDEELIELLIQEETLKSHFFKKIKDVYIFELNKFLDFISDKHFLSNSSTKFRNKIGLAVGNTYLHEQSHVVLNFPFKDCVLKGGQDKEESKRKEIFYNEILAPDEIDRLFDNKILTNFKKFTKKGEERVTQFNRDETGLIRDNLIIKGNNLLALHSLKQEFAGKVKLIYIDPPYNTGSDSFGYNDRFNHSTWLTFMKNRLEIAKELLREDGVISVQCDDNEQAYLKVLMDEIFERNFVQNVAVKRSTSAGFKSINLCPITTKEYILIYGKKRTKELMNSVFIEAERIDNYDYKIINIDDSPENWEFISLNQIFLDEFNFEDWKEAKNELGESWKEHRDIFLKSYSLKNTDSIISFRDVHKPSGKVLEYMERSKLDSQIHILKRENYDDMYFHKGRSITFLKNKLRIIDNQLVPSEILSDFWKDISWDGIAGEGNITLKNGKKT